MAFASVAVPTVERGLPPIRSWSTMMAVVSPSRTSTSGRASVGMKPCTKALYVSLIIRCDSAAIVSNTSELLPEPDTPVKTVSRRFGMSRLMPRRLFSRAPRTSMAPQSVSSSSARRFLHELGEPGFDAGGQLGHGEGHRPHLAIVDPGVRLEAERRVPHLELRGGLEETDDLAVPGVRRHPVVRPRHERRRGGTHEGVDSLGHDALCNGHLGDLRLDVALALDPLVGRATTRGRLALSRALLHRRPLFIRPDLGGGPSGGAGLR